jgi:polyribonucleotide nucleotidyltransferase
LRHVEIDGADARSSLETGRIARQADGAVLATYGETTVLATVVAAKQPRAGIDFFPLTVNYQERPSPPARFPAASSSARAGRPKRRR